MLCVTLELRISQTQNYPQIIPKKESQEEILLLSLKDPGFSQKEMYRHLILEKIIFYFAYPPKGEIV